MSSQIQQYSRRKLGEIADNFADELQSAAQGKKTSFAYVKNALPGASLHKDEEKQVLVIGGTYCESAMVKGSFISSYQKFSLPQITTARVLFKFLEGVVDKKSTTLLINFAYPLESILRNRKYLDGRLISGTKEHRFTGLVGKVVGVEIVRYFAQKRGQKVQVSLANDTVCLGLSGIANYPSEQIIAGIVGTGVNFGFFPTPKLFINLEAGNFNRFPTSSTCQAIDKKTADPGRQLFEKEVGGAYLHLHYNLLAKDAKLPPVHSAKELSILAQGTGVSAGLAGGLLVRSAQLAAAAIAGIYFYKGSKQIQGMMEGSLFWEGYGYRDTIVDCLGELGLPYQHISFHKIPRGSILGAAHLLGA